MAVGLPMKTTYADGDMYSAQDVNDITGTMNLVGQTNNFYAGKNKIINGDFSVNQRNFTSTTTNDTFGFDRLALEYSGGTGTYSAQTFTPGTAPVAGYEAKNFARLVTASQSTTSHYASLKYRIEDVRTFAGQTATFSIWAKASTGTPKIGFGFVQGFGVGGSSDVIVTNSTTSTISSSWARYSVTVSIPSISGKTIGTGSYLQIYLFTSVGTVISALGYPAVGVQNVTIDLWGLQAENGSTATAFQTATGTIQGELAACQRYYFRLVTGNAGAFMNAHYYTSTQINATVTFPVTMRAIPSLDVGTGTDYYLFIKTGANDGINSLTIGSDTTTQTGSVFNSTQALGTAGYAGYLYSANASAYVGFISEL